jgi:hypothetical protein
MKKAKFTTILALFLTLLAGCSSTAEITHAWVDPEVKKGKYEEFDGVLIVAVLPNEAERADFEDAFAKALKSKGVRAVPAHQFLPAKATDEEIVAVAKRENLDGIILTRYIGEVAKQDVYHPGTLYYGVAPAYGPSYGRFGGYHGRAYEIAYEQPVWSTNTTLAVISDLFETETGAHLWQANSETIDVGRLPQVRDSFIRAFIKLMREQGLLD